MEVNEFESNNLLIEILSIRELLNELYHEKGPNSSDYITLSVKHISLINQFFEEIRLTLIKENKYGQEF